MTADPFDISYRFQRANKLRDSTISEVTLNTIDIWEVEGFDRFLKLVNRVDADLTRQTRKYKTWRSKHRVVMRLRYSEGKRPDRIIIGIHVETTPPRVKTKFQLTMYIIDQEHYRHVILRNHSISVQGDDNTYHFEVNTPTLETLWELIWKDKTLHIGSYLEELISDSNAIDEEPRCPSENSYNKRLVIREIDPQVSTRPDVVFINENRQMFAHRSIVEHHSTYLRDAICQFSCQLNNITSVDLTTPAQTIGLTPLLFEAIFDYMYGRKSISELSRYAFELLPLASTLGMDSMKEGLEHFIYDRINELNIVKVLLLFKKCECEFLRPKAVAYAKSRLDIIANSERFEELCNDPILMREICCVKRR